MPAPQSLLSYQTAWLRDEAGIAVIEKSRRIGISWAEALGAVRHASRRNDPGNVYYQSYAKDMTSGFIGDCADWAETLQRAAAAVDALSGFGVTHVDMMLRPEKLWQIIHGGQA